MTGQRQEKNIKLSFKMQTFFFACSFYASFSKYSTQLTAMIDAIDPSQRIIHKWHVRVTSEVKILTTECVKLQCPRAFALLLGHYNDASSVINVQLILGITEQLKPTAALRKKINQSSQNHKNGLAESFIDPNKTDIYQNFHT